MDHEVPRFFDVEDRLSRPSDLGDQLEVFSRTLVFEVVCPDLEKALFCSDGDEEGVRRLIRS